MQKLLVTLFQNMHCFWRQLLLKRFRCFFVDEKDFGDNLSSRLKKSLQKDDLVLENSSILLKAKTEDFVFYVATLMVQQFMELIKDCEEKQDSPSVFELRRNAFVQDWVNRFLGMDKYAE